MPGGFRIITHDVERLARFYETVTGTVATRSAPVFAEVADVDAEFARLRYELDDVVLEPTTMPWGNRSTLFRDPDGNLVNLFARPSL